MFEITTDKIVSQIIDLTDSLESSEQLDEAWSKIGKALSYLSAKDTMFKTRKELTEVIE